MVLAPPLLDCLATVDEAAFCLVVAYSFACMILTGEVVRSGDRVSAFRTLESVLGVRARVSFYVTGTVEKVASADVPIMGFPVMRFPVGRERR